MQRNCDEDSGRSSCSAASLGLSPVLDYPVKTQDQAVKRRYITKQQDLTNTELKVSSRPRSCISLIKSPDEKEPFPSYRHPRPGQRNHVLSVFNTPRRGGLTNAHSTLDIASSTHIEQPKLQTNAVSLNTVTIHSETKHVAPPSNFKRNKPVQRVASRLYKADAPRGQHKVGCVGPEFIVRASQPAKQIDLTLSAFAAKRTIIVVLLNGHKFELLCEPNTVTAGQLFEAVIVSEKYEHNFMLGLAALIGGDFIFLPDEYKIKKIAPDNWCIKPGSKKKVVEDVLPITLFLRIKFFLPTNIARNIQGGEWRYRVYLQLRRATVEGQLTSTLQNIILLAGYALHVEFGEFSYREHGTADYFLLEHYLPETSINADNMLDVKLRMKRSHESRRGLERTTAIMSFITLAQTFRDYGAHFYSAVWATRDGFCRDVWLSIGPKGITLYSRLALVSGDSESNRSRIVLQNLPWHHIHTFYYNKKSLYIIPNANSGMSKIGVKYKLKMADNKSYFAFWLASLHHRLYLKLYSKEDFINYFLDELSCPQNRAQDCSNYQDSYNLAVRNNPLRMRKPIKKRFRVDIFSDKKAQNKENQKPNTEELLRQILVPPIEESLANTSPKSNPQANSSNDGLSSSESSLPRRHGVKMGTRVFNGMKSRYTTSPMSNYSTQLRRSQDLATTQSDSDDLGSTSDKLRHCNIDSMKLLPERQYNTDQGPTAYVLESPKVYPEVFNYNATTNESYLNASIYQKLDTLGCVQGERVFVTATLERDEHNTLGIQVAEGSDGNVYIKSITTGGPADNSKKLLAGDQIISVNGQTLLNVKYDKALSMLQSAPAKVELIVLQNTNATVNQESDSKSSCDTINAAILSQPKNMNMQSIASGLEDLEITDDELLNEEALKTIYALIKLTKEKVISRIKDNEIKKSTNMNKPLSKCYSANIVYDESDMFSSQENSPQKDSQKFNTWRGLPNNQRPKRRPLSLSIPSDVHLADDYLDEELTNNLMNNASLKCIQSSMNSVDSKSVKSSGSSKNVALPRNFGLSRKWIGPVRYPVTPCKNADALNKSSATNIDSSKKRFTYGSRADSDDDQIFL